MLKKYFCIVMAALTALLAGCTQKTETKDISEIGEGLTIYSFNAGKADAHLIYSDDWAVLIDCGEKGFGKTITAYMQENGIEKLDYLIITHFDKDHVGGAAKVLKEWEVGAVLQSNSPKDSDEYENYLKALENKQMTAETVRERMNFTLGEAQFTVDPPRQEVYEKDPSNNSSLITEVTLGEVNMLFAGDAEDDRLEEYTASVDKVYSYVKVPYHGHWQKNLTAFADKVKAKIAVITSSDAEPEDNETVVLFEKQGAEVFRTRTGDVIVKCDGTDIAAAYDK
ncbi:MBL fold metallo-hydrolase [Ruminococcus sp.]|uniref:ComEC/Rec2 family competence protein n=1 Tax=Ruminococcus sp. TaxID=41978 RepID=UPI0025D42E05|nr:MBL fold metallo-hydrolase [Ruminococcus sp.]